MKKHTSGRNSTTEDLAAIGKRRLMLYMDIETVDELDNLAQALGLSRSQAITQLIEGAPKPRRKPSPGHR